LSLRGSWLRSRPGASWRRTRRAGLGNELGLSWSASIPLNGTRTPSRRSLGGPDAPPSGRLLRWSRSPCKRATSERSRSLSAKTSAIRSRMAAEKGLSLPVAGESPSHDPAALGEGLRVRLGPQLVEKLRRALDVGEEERNRAGREVVSHHVRAKIVGRSLPIQSATVGPVHDARKPLRDRVRRKRPLSLRLK
jgi:hypothetical protein